MKIRPKILLISFIIGITPVVLSFTLLSILTWYQSDSHVKNSLANTWDDLKNKIEMDMENKRNYAYSYAKSINKFTPHDIKYSIGHGASAECISVYDYNIKILELSYKDEVIACDIAREYYSDYQVFRSSKEFVKEIWSFLLKPYYSSKFKMSFPEITSNKIFIRNCAFIYDFKKQEKIGLTIIGIPLDQEYLKNISLNNSD